MWIRSAFASGKSGPSRSPRPRPRPTPRRLTLESLERRLTLSLTTLASFNGTDGKGPWDGVITDSSGNLYGTTQMGAAVQGIAAGFVVSTGQPMGAAGVLAGAERTDGGFEPVEVAAHDMAGNKATILTTEQVKSPAGGEELVPAIGDIDLFSLRDRGTEWWWTGHGNSGIRIRW
jgi:hypothetical protein